MIHIRPVVRRAALLSLLLLPACGSDTTGPQAGPAASVAVQPVHAAVTVGFTRQLVAVVKDADGIVILDPQVSWKSSNESLAHVANDGVASGIAAGDVVVTATVDGIEGTGTLSVIAAQSAAGDTIPLTIRRLDGGSGEVVVSTGIPLPPGYLHESQLNNVALLVGGQEQSLYVEALKSHHPDGSLRSILVQFSLPVSAGTPQDGFLLVGTEITRHAPDVGKTAVQSVPAAVALPTSPDYLVRTLLVGPSVTAVELPAGFFRTWETDFETVGETRWSDDDMAVVDYHQYDRALVWYAGWVRTGNPLYWERGTRAAVAYRQIAQPNFDFQPHFQEVQGQDVHYMVTGDEVTRTAVREMAAFMDDAYGPYIDKDPVKDWMDSRIQTRVLITAMFAARLEVDGDWDGITRRDLDQILGTQSPDGAMRWLAWDNEHAVFMASLLIHAMIEYYTWFDEDPRIPPFIKRILDFVHPALWVGDSWQYTSANPEPTVDLNQLNAIGYAWYGWFSGEQAYSDIARTAFEYGVTDAYLGYKQFNQNYRGAFQTAYYLLK